MGVRLVVGLGNPGDRYAGTRHNVGFLAADAFLSACGGSWSASPAGKGLVGRVELSGGASVLVAKPHTYMNDSGELVGPLARYYRVPGPEILVVSDDMDLPLGRLRLRLGGSSGGQKGLDSVLRHLGTKDVPRLRLGIGPRPKEVPGADFVLGRFSREEGPLVERMIGRAVEAVREACLRGVESAMNAHNAAPEEP